VSQLPRIGLLGIMQELYDEMIPGITEHQAAYAAEVAEQLSGVADVSFTRPARNQADIEERAAELVAEGVDGIMIVMLTYGPAMRSVRALRAVGVPLLLALDITGRTGGNVAVEEAMEGVIASVKRGGTIAAPLAQAPIFPMMVTHMVGVGEETGALDSMLDKVAEFYEDRVEASVKALTSIMEPVMIIAIGSMVGFIVISMYLPLFEVYNHIE